MLVILSGLFFVILPLFMLLVAHIDVMIKSGFRKVFLDEYELVKQIEGRKIDSVSFRLKKRSDFYNLCFAAIL